MQTQDWREAEVAAYILVGEMQDLNQTIKDLEAVEDKLFEASRSLMEIGFTLAERYARLFA